MSTYLTAKAALLTLVRAYNGGTFTAGNSSREDWRVLDSPTGVAAVVTGAGDSVEADMVDRYGIEGYYQERHLFAVNVCKAVGTGADGIATITTDLETLTEAIKDHLRPYTLLDNTAGVRRMQIVRTSRPGTIAERPQWYMQTITIQVDCESELPESEA